jgi:hypothetical protein
MASGKRTSTEHPLTEHDVAERLDHAAMRTLGILMLARDFGMMEDVKASRYLTNSLNALIAELELWKIKPIPLEE